MSNEWKACAWGVLGLAAVIYVGVVYGADAGFFAWTAAVACREFGRMAP